MPPKLRLALDSTLSKESAAPVNVKESMQCTDNGTLRVMSESLQEYKFNAEGMTRGNSRLLEGDQPYKVHKCMHAYVAMCYVPINQCQCNSSWLKGLTCAWYSADITEGCAGTECAWAWCKQRGKLCCACYRLWTPCIDCSARRLAGITLRLGLLQVMKAFYLKGNFFVAIKKINAFEKV